MGRKPSQVCDMSRWFGKNMRRIRKEKGIGLREISRQLGMGENHISRIETGQLNPNLNTVEKVVKILGCGVCILFEEVR